MFRKLEVLVEHVVWEPVAYLNVAFFCARDTTHLLLTRQCSELMPSVSD